MDSQLVDKRMGSLERSNSMMSSKSIDNEEMMVIEINFGKNRKDDIVVHFGDNPVSLAEEFVKKHKLKERAVPTIAHHIIDTVEAHLQATGGLSPTAEILERGKSPLGPSLKSFSPKGHSLKNIFKSDSAGNQSSDDASDMSFGVSPIIRDSFRESFDGGEPPSGEPSPQRASGQFSSPSRQRSSDGVVSMKSRQQSYEATGENDTGSVGAPSTGAEDMPGQIRKPETFSIINSQGQRLGVEGSEPDDEAASYNDMKRAWQHSSAKKTQMKLTNKLAPSKHSEGLIVATSSSKKAGQRAAIFSGHVTDSSFRRITANERLYQSASVRAQRKEAKINESAVNLDQELARGRESIKVKGKSKEIVASLSQRDAAVDISRRLYEEAVSIRQLKGKIETNTSQKPRQDMWSCPLCCTYHEPVKKQIYSLVDEKHCTACGWKGVTAETPFKPVAIDLQYEISGVDRTKMILNSHKRRGVKCPNGETTDFDIHEYLYRDNLHQREKVLLMQNKWNEEEAKLTFKPEIPIQSLHLLSKKMTVSMASTEVDCTTDSIRSHLRPHDRLHNTTISCQDNKVLASENHVAKTVNAQQHSDFVNRLTYEYVEKEKRQEELKRLFLETDLRTGRPLFKPTIPGAPITHVMNITEDGIWTDGTGSLVEEKEEKKEKIYEKLLRRGEEHKERMKKLQEHFLQHESLEREDKSKHSLPESARILQESSENSIGEIFKVLLTCQMHNEAKAVDEPEGVLKRAQSLDPEILLKISSELSNWREGVLNIADAAPDLMIESVQSLLTAVIRLSQTKNCNAKYPDIYSKYDNPLLLDLQLFSEHVWNCIKKREGGGRSYLFLPKRELSPKKVEETPPFKPAIDSKSNKIASSSRDSALPVEDILLTKYEHSQLRLEDIKRDVEQERYADCTFQPQLYRPGREFKPRTKYQSTTTGNVPPPPPSALAVDIARQHPKSRRGLVVSASRVSATKAQPTHQTPDSAFDFEQESVDNSNDSITVPRHSIASGITIDSPPELKRTPYRPTMNGRGSESSGGVSQYSPPWIQK